MTKSWQIYYNAVFGGLGGLLGWFFVGLLPAATWDVNISNLLVGAGIGLFIGGAIGIVDGLLIKKSTLRTFTGGIASSIAGLLGGAFGLFLGGLVFILLEGGLIPRMLGWMAFGLFLGLGQGIISFNIKRAIYGLIGGILAGLVGGALYEIFTQVFLDQSAEAQVFLSAIGLILMGMSLGSIIPWSVDAIARAVGQHGLIVILTGPRANREISVIGSATIGSSDACDVYLPDSAVSKRQALISKEQQGFIIRNEGDQFFTSDQQSIPPNVQTDIHDGSQIQMGETLLEFRTR